MKALCAILLLILSAAYAQAAPFSGMELLERCAAYEKSLDGGSLSSDEGLDAMWCMGYVSGLLDGFGVADFKIGDVKAVCPPEGGITRSQAVRMITDWLRTHPDEQRNNGRRGAVLALSRSMPCQHD